MAQDHGGEADDEKEEENTLKKQKKKKKKKKHKKKREDEDSDNEAWEEKTKDTIKQVKVFYKLGMQCFVHEYSSIQLYFTNV